MEHTRLVHGASDGRLGTVGDTPHAFGIAMLGYACYTCDT